jgi:hypothetical protein
MTITMHVAAPLINAAAIITAAIIGIGHRHHHRAAIASIHSYVTSNTSGERSYQRDSQSNLDLINNFHKS